MKRETRWSPDTCGCVFDYEWDDTDDEVTRVHTYKRVVSVCPAHEALPGQDAYGEVVSENTRKNIVLGIVREMLPGAAVGSDNYNWSFDNDRMLHAGFINVPEFPGVKGLVLAACNARFGPGKVKVL